jgi:serine protease Do
MASFDPMDQFPFDPNGAPPRPATPPVRRGFLMVLAVLSLLTILVYGVPQLAERIGYSYESGRARAASEALAKLDKEKVVNMASALFREAVVKVSPAVVNIRGVVNRKGQSMIESGSGFVIDKDRGYVVTNHHVVQNAEELVARLWTGGEYPAKVIGVDPKTDLAVLQVQGSFSVAATWGDSDKVDVGDWVLALGSPLLMERTVTSGIVSAKGRRELRPQIESALEDYIQTDAALNQGNSGGPLIDLRGDVVGINTLIISPNTGGQGIGMAISANLAKQVVASLIKHGRVIRGYLGVALENLTPDQARRLKVPEGKGALITMVEPGSPADRAGLRARDVVVNLGDTPIPDKASLRLRTTSLAAGTKVPVTVIRNGTSKTLQATIAELPTLLAHGLVIRDLQPEDLRVLPDTPEKAVGILHVEPGSAADRAGIMSHVRILAVGQTPVATKAECDAAAAKLDLSAGIPLRLQTLEGRQFEVQLQGHAAQP